jgi:hypothetical protein
MKDKNRLGLIAVVVLALVVCTTIFFSRVLPADVFHWDEGHHALYGMWLTRDVQAGDWDSFWEHTHRQAYWPFFHSWLLTTFFLIFGMTYVSARLLSLVLFFAIIPLVYLISLRTDERQGWIVGIMASLLVLLSPFLVMFAAVNMIEMLGAFIFVLATYFYLKGAESRTMWTRVSFYSLLGLVLGICIVTKYNYAMYLIPSVAVVLFLDFVSEIKSAGQKIFHVAQKYLAVLVPLLLIAVWWFTSYDMERKIQMVLYTKGAHLESGLGFFEHHLFYLRTIIDHFSFSQWIGALILLSVPGSLFFYKNRIVRAISLLFIISVLVTNFSVPWRLPRFISMQIPWALIIFSFVAVKIVGVISNLEPRKKAAFSLLLIIVLLPSIFALHKIPSIFSLDDAAPGRAMNLLNYFKGAIPKGSQISTMIKSNRLSPYTFSFHFADWGAPVYGQFDARNPAFIRSGYFATMEQLDEGAPLGKDMGAGDELKSWNVVLERARRDGLLVLYDEAEFADINIRAKIYKRMK